ADSAPRNIRFGVATAPRQDLAPSRGRPESRHRASAPIVANNIHRKDEYPQFHFPYAASGVSALLQEPCVRRRAGMAADPVRPRVGTLPHLAARVRIKYRPSGPQVSFLARGSGYALLLGGAESVLAMGSHDMLRIAFCWRKLFRSGGPLPGRSNRFTGKNAIV